MTERFERLRGADFDEAMAFLNDVFSVHGPHDFAQLLPSIYQPDDEHMAHNLALRRDGRLLAIVGVFPIELCVGSERLRVAGVGGVSVARDQQGQGLFERLMLAARDVMQSEGYALSHLSGRRQRYRHFGWEVTGANLRFLLEPHNLLHTFRDAPQPALTLEPLPRAPDAELVRQLVELYDLQALRAARPRQRFPHFLRSWEQEPLVARDAQGRVLGYVTGDSRKRELSELVATSTAVALEILRAVSARFGAPLQLELRALPSALTDELGRIAERMEIRASGNWQIWDLPAVAGALLRARHAARPLPAGRVVLRERGASEGFELWVDGEQAGGERSSAEPDFEAPRDELVRSLFGPLPPALVGPLPSAAGLLAAWCPLPLGLAAGDQV
jgi:predicted N-acetyltransferase YhbS